MLHAHNTNRTLLRQSHAVVDWVVALLISAPIRHPLLPQNTVPVCAFVQGSRHLNQQSCSSCYTGAAQLLQHHAEGRGAGVIQVTGTTTSYLRLSHNVIIQHQSTVSILTEWVGSSPTPNCPCSVCMQRAQAVKATWELASLESMHAACMHD